MNDCDRHIAKNSRKNEEMLNDVLIDRGWEENRNGDCIYVFFSKVLIKSISSKLSV